MNRVQDKQVVTFDFSGHYVRIEEPDKYCEVIESYIGRVNNFVYSLFLGKN